MSRSSRRATTILLCVFRYLLILRTSELAIRAALGAGPLQIARTLWRELGVVLAAGAVSGAIASAASRRVLAALVTDTAGAGSLDLAIGFLILVAIVFAAGLAPTIRAVRMDIARALRTG